MIRLVIRYPVIRIPHFGAGFKQSTAPHIAWLLAQARLGGPLGYN